MVNFSRCRRSWCKAQIFVLGGKLVVVFFVVVLCYYFVVIDVIVWIVVAHRDEFLICTSMCVSIFVLV